MIARVWHGPMLGTHRLPPLPIAALVVAAVVANAWFVGWTLVELVSEPAAFDWDVLVESGRRIQAGSGLYDHGPYYLFVWSPVAAWIMALVGLMGTLAWRALHLLAVLLVPDRRLQLLILLSWPFWVDLEAGNVMTFVFVAAVHALRGSAVGGGAFMVFFLLAPRPLLLPVFAWLLWHRPGWRLPFIALFAAHAALVALSGWGPEWLDAMLANSRELDNDMNVGPSQWIGALWIPIGLALAAILTLRGRLGWASLAASPYWLPMYLIMGFLEFSRETLWAGRPVDGGKPGRGAGGPVRNSTPAEP